MLPSPKNLTVLTLILILAIRICTLGTSSLIDTTEGRYASIAQEMALSGDWVTPRINMESGLVPYKGKPPFHFWITAFSLNTFGMNEVAARLPSFLGGLLTIFLTFYFSRTYLTKEIAILSSLILASSGQFFLLWGTVHLDFTLTAAITGMIVSWFRFSFPISTDTKWSPLFFTSTLFLSAAIGMLTKGPISIVLAALPIGIWSILRGEVKKSLSLPWVYGLSLFLICVSPWFYYAEVASPGFIKYFFINENFLRYVSKEYGDQYGAGHTAFRGASVLMLLQGLLPWSLVLLFFIKKLKISKETFLTWIKSYSGFALLWGVMPALFFTLSKQLLPAYMLPGFGGCSIILALLILKLKDSSHLLSQIFKWFNIVLPIISIILILIGAVYFYSSPVQIEVHHK